MNSSEPGGKVSVSLNAENNMASLAITDLGVGIPTADRKLVFERFFRGGNVRHEGTAGSGLGLSLARAVVHVHGGTIDLVATGDGSALLVSGRGDPGPTTAER